jgi:hypothetical protein
MLLVKPTCAPGWVLTGGMTEANVAVAPSGVTGGRPCAVQRAAQPGQSACGAGSVVPVSSWERSATDGRPTGQSGRVRDLAIARVRVLLRAGTQEHRGAEPGYGAGGYLLGNHPGGGASRVGDEDGHSHAAQDHHHSRAGKSGARLKLAPRSPLCSPSRCRAG